jgi:hypothetical protein
VEQTEPKGPYGNGYIVCNPKSNLEDVSEAYKYKNCYFWTSDGKEFEIGDTSSYLYPKDNHWVFQVWESVPGPAAEDFVCEFSSLQLAIDAAIDFYFGKPTIIEGWVFPLHRHPELNFELIEPVIKNALRVTGEEFNRISTQLWEKVKGNWPIHGWEKVLIGDFLEIPHITNKFILLMVRRDLKESYLICD